jgi:hypothetical protein
MSQTISIAGTSQSGTSGSAGNDCQHVTEPYHGDSATAPLRVRCVRCGAIMTDTAISSSYTTKIVGAYYPDVHYIGRVKP